LVNIAKCRAIPISNDSLNGTSRRKARLLPQLA
jgi:hypothetical protein